jgi:hypothetical protein
MWVSFFYHIHYILRFTSLWSKAHLPKGLLFFLAYVAEFLGFIMQTTFKLNYFNVRLLYYICVLILIYMCPHTTIYVSSYYYICVLILLTMYRVPWLYQANDLQAQLL